jgi:hypothetical protein
MAGKYSDAVEIPMASLMRIIYQEQSCAKVPDTAFFRWHPVHTGSHCDRIWAV